MKRCVSNPLPFLIVFSHSLLIFTPPFFVFAEALLFLSRLLLCAEDDFVSTEGADSSDKSSERDEGHKPQHRESNERWRVVMDRWPDDGTKCEMRQGG